VKRWLPRLLWSLLLLAISGPACRGETLDRLEAIARQAKSLDDFLARKELVAQYGKALIAYQHRNRFRCDSYEKIIGELRVLNQTVPDLGRRLWAPLTVSSVTIPVMDIPKDDENSTETPAAMHTVTFRAVPRRLHGIWNDPSIKGCTKNGCDRIEAMVPERWAIALKESEIYYVERDGIFSDLSLLLTPVARDGRVYPLLTLGGGPELMKTIQVQDADHQIQETTLLKQWISAVTPRLPKKWHSFVMVRSGTKKENYQRLVERLVRDRKQKRWEGAPHEFTTEDKIARAIEAASTNQCVATLDAPLDSKFLGMLSPKPTNFTVIANNPKTVLDPSDPAAVKLGLATVKYGDLGLLDDLPTTSSKIVESTLTQTFLSDPSPQNRLAAGMALNERMKRPSFNGTTEGVRDRELASRTPLDNIIAASNKALSDPDPTVRGIAGLNLVQNGIQTPQTIMPAILASHPPFYGPSGKPGGPYINDPNYLNGVADSVLKPNSPITGAPIVELMKSYKDATPEDRRTAAKMIAETLRNSPNPDDIAKQIYGTVLEGEPKLKELRDEVTKELHNSQTQCKPSWAKKGGKS
jgi:hypothetical protein